MKFGIKKSIKTLLAVSSFSTGMALAGNAFANELTPLWQQDNFDQPESVIPGPNGQNLYVSNINGAPTELNGKGYISKLSVDGKVIQQHWLEGMDAPKGLAISGDSLYVADMQQVHVVSLSKRKIIKQYQAPQAKMLNDITIDNEGNVYISDLLGGGIYRIKDQTINQWFTHNLLPHPNGLSWKKGKLMVASWGLGMNNDFTTKTAGSLYNLDPENPNLIPLKAAQQLGNLDGIAFAKGAIFVSDWITGDVYKIHNNKHQKVLTQAPGLADISAQGNVLFTPLMMEGKIKAWRL